MTQDQDLITQLELALQKERVAHASAQEALIKKDEFLAMLVHELRTPLQVISSWCELISTGKLTVEQTQRGALSILKGIEFQKQLIRDLMELSRVTSGGVPFDLKPLELKSLLLSTLDSIAPLLQSKSIALETHLSDSEYWVQGDPQHLQQVFWNLLSNSIKFTDVAGKIEIRLAFLSDQAEITIRDNGIGISPDFLPYVFDRFCQGNTSQRNEGLGLGLAIVKSFVEKHHGTVQVKSAGVNQGCLFQVRLPLIY